MPHKISLKVLPRSSKNELIALPDGSYKVKLTAAPVDGEANKKLLEFLAKEFGVVKSRIWIVKGERSKNKVIEISV